MNINSLDSCLRRNDEFLANLPHLVGGNQALLILGMPNSITYSHCSRILIGSLPSKTMTLRNLILIVGLALFLIGYVGYWAYTSLYLEPRKELGNEIAKLSGEIDRGRNNLNMRKQSWNQNQGFYYRSLPRTPNDAQQYSFWLFELLQYSGLDDNRVDDGSYSRVPTGWNYRFTVQCTGSLSQLSYFLFEFYYAPFLHRITSMTLTPTEGNREKLTFSMTVNALALQPRDLNDPYPSRDQLPTGFIIPRLMFNDLAVYNVIAERNIMQTAKGGTDPADYTFLSAIITNDGQEEVWFSVRTDDSLIKTKLGGSIHSGSFSGRVVEILDQDIVLDRNGSRWLLTVGESLNEAFVLPPETGERTEEE